MAYTGWGGAFMGIDPSPVAPEHKNIPFDILPVTPVKMICTLPTLGIDPQLVISEFISLQMKIHGFLCYRAESVQFSKNIFKRKIQSKK